MLTAKFYKTIKHPENGVSKQCDIVPCDSFSSHEMNDHACISTNAGAGGGRLWCVGNYPHAEIDSCIYDEVYVENQAGKTVYMWTR